MTYDRVAWRNIAKAAKELERARKTGGGAVEATEHFWNTVNENPLYK